MAHIIEGTWEEIKRHEAEFVGHRLWLIIDPVVPLSTIRDQGHLEELHLDRLNSAPAMRATPELWGQTRNRMLKGVGSVIGQGTSIHFPPTGRAAARLRDRLAAEATDDPEEIRKAQEELDQMKSNMNRERQRTGAESIF